MTKKFNVQLANGLQCRNVLDNGKELGNKFEVPNVEELHKAVNMMIQQKLVAPAIAKLESGQSATVLDMTITPVAEEAPATSGGDSVTEVAATAATGDCAQLVAAMMETLSKFVPKTKS